MYSNGMTCYAIGKYFNIDPSVVRYYVKNNIIIEEVNEQ